MRRTASCMARVAKRTRSNFSFFVRTFCEIVVLVGIVCLVVWNRFFN